MLTVNVGDLFESGNRNQMLWSVDTVITVPGQGNFVRLIQLDGMGRVNISVDDLMCLQGFRRISEARVTLSEATPPLARRHRAARPAL